MDFGCISPDSMIKTDFNYKPIEFIEIPNDELFLASGEYSRCIRVSTKVVKCFECEKKKKCLCFDSSDGEYSTMIFCRDCLNKFCDGYSSKSDYSRDLSNQAILED